MIESGAYLLPEKVYDDQELSDIADQIRDQFILINEKLKVRL